MNPEDNLDLTDELDSDLEKLGGADSVQDQVADELEGKHDIAEGDHQSVVKEFFRTLDIKASDPFKAVELEHNAFLEKVTAQELQNVNRLNNQATRLTAINETLNAYQTQITQQHGNRLRQSLLAYGGAITNRSYGYIGPETGLTFRARTEDYLAFSKSLGTSRLDMAVFQVQNQELLGGFLYGGVKKLQITTQLDEPIAPSSESVNKWYENERQRFGITGPNEVLASAFRGRQIEKYEVTVGGSYIKKLGDTQRGLMHAKIAALYEGDETNERLVGAFIGTQNFTRALASTRTEEETLFISLKRDQKHLESPNPSKRGHAQIRQRIAQEIALVTEGIRENFTKARTSQELTADIDSKLQNRNNVSYGTHVLPAINEMLSSAVTKDRHVLLNMQYIEKFLAAGSGHEREIYHNLKTLAAKNRLTVAISETSLAKDIGYYSLMNQVKEGTVNNTLIHTLLQQDAFAVLPTRFLHTKSIAIFGDAALTNLVEYGIGSQNLSEEKYTSADLNFETWIRLTQGESRENSKDELAALGIYRSSGQLAATARTRSQLYVDRMGSFTQVQTLLGRLREMGGTDAHLFDALKPGERFKYNVRYKALGLVSDRAAGSAQSLAERAMSGVDIYLPSANNYRLSATISEEYTQGKKMPVVYLNTGNRIITGAIYRIARDLEGTVTLPNGREAKAGDTVKLSALDVFQSFIETVVKATEYERNYRAPVLVLRSMGVEKLSRFIDSVPGDPQAKRDLLYQLLSPENKQQQARGSLEAIQLLQSVIRADPTGRLQRMEAAFVSAGIRNVVSNISASFLQPHEELYSGGHLTAIMPIFGMDNTIFSKHFSGRSGTALLNPYKLSHYDLINTGGLDLFRGVQDSTQIRTTNWQDLEGGLYHSEGGPTKVTDIAQFIRSTKNMAVIDEQSLKESAKDFKDLGLTSNIQLTPGTSLYVMPYGKAEQISARLKNKKSERVLLEPSDDLLKFIQQGGSNANNLIQNNNLIRNAVPVDLPPEQFAIYSQILDEQGGDPTKTLKILRERQSNPLTAMQGLLGASQYQKVLISAGFSMQSDFSYFNEKYLDRPLVDQTIKSYSFSSDNVGSALTLARQAQQKLRKGTMFLAEDINVKDYSMESYYNAFVTKYLENTEGTYSWRENVDPETRKQLEKMLFVDLTATAPILKLKKGVYYNDSQEILGLQKIGNMNSTSLTFTIDGLEVQSRENSKLQTFTLPLDNSAISRRAHRSIAVLKEDATISQQGPNIRLEATYSTLLFGQTGMRTMSPKGPIYSVMEEFFKRLAENRDWNYNAVAVVNPSQIKDYNFGDGFFKLSDPNHFLRGGVADAKQIEYFRQGLQSLIDTGRSTQKSLEARGGPLKWGWDVYQVLGALELNKIEGEITEREAQQKLQKVKELSAKIYGNEKYFRGGAIVSNTLTRGLSILATVSSQAEDIATQKEYYLNRQKPGALETEISYDSAALIKDSAARKYVKKEPGVSQKTTALEEYLNDWQNPRNRARESQALIFGINLRNLQVNELTAAFELMEATYGNNIMLRANIDLSFSRIAVSMGMKTETKLEAAYAMAMTQNQLKAYTYQKGGAEGLQGALVMLAQLNNRVVSTDTVSSYYSFAGETNLLEFGLTSKIAEKAKESKNWRNQLRANAFVAAFTSKYSIYSRQDLIEVEENRQRRVREEPIKSLVDEFEKGLFRDIAPETKLLTDPTNILLNRMERYGGIMRSINIKLAAEEMIKELFTYKNTKLAENYKDLESGKLTDKKFIAFTKDVNLTRDFPAVTSFTNNNFYENWLSENYRSINLTKSTKVSTGKKLDQNLLEYAISFITERLSPKDRPEVTNYHQLLAVIKRAEVSGEPLTFKSYYQKRFRETFDTPETLEYYTKLITKSRERISSNDGSEYLESMRSLALYAAKNSTLMRSVQQSQLLHLPMLEMTGNGDSLKYHLSDQVVSGARYGLDILEQISLVFHGYSSNILIEQRSLQSYLTEAINTGLLKKITQGVQRGKADLDLNTKEVELYQKLLTTLGNTPQSIQTLFEAKDVMRQSEGDRLKMVGTTYVGINSALVAVKDLILGSQIEHVFNAGGTQGTQGLAQTLMKELNAGRGRAQEASNQALAIKRLYLVDSGSIELPTAESFEPQSNTLREIAEEWKKAGKTKDKEAKQAQELRFYETLLGLTAGELNPGETHTDKLSSLYRIANAVRTGAPYGIAQDSALIPVQVKGLEALRAAGQATDTYLLPGKHNATAMISSSLSYMFTQLGDYDGDTFQVAFPAMVQALAKIKLTQNRLASLKPGTTAFKNTQAEMIDFQKQHTEAINAVTEHLQDITEAQRSALQRFSSRYYGFDKELLQNMTNEELQHLSLQFRDTMSGSDKGAEYVNESWKLITRLVKAAETVKSSELLDYGTQLDHLGLTDGKLKNDLAEALGQDKFIKIDGLTVREYINQLQTLKNAEFADVNIRSMLKNAMGTVLNGVELETLGAVVGTTGMGMLGVTYNSVTPLMELVQGQEMAQRALSKGDGEALLQGLVNRAQTALNKTINLERSQLIKALDLQVGIAHNFSLTTQQFMRDAALKPKQGMGILELAANYQLSERLKEAANSKTTEEEKRTAVELTLKRFINTKVGNQLETGSANNYSAFAALTLVNEYLGSKLTAEEIIKDGMLSGYLTSKKTAGITADRLVATEITKLHNLFKIDYVTDHILKVNSSVNGGVEKLVEIIKDTAYGQSVKDKGYDSEAYVKGYLNERFNSAEYTEGSIQLLMKGKQFSQELQKIAAGESSLVGNLGKGVSQYLAAATLHNRKGGDQTARLNLMHQLRSSFDTFEDFYRSFTSNVASNETSKAALAISAVSGLLPTEVASALEAATPDQRMQFLGSAEVQNYVGAALQRSGAIAAGVTSNEQQMRLLGQIVRADTSDSGTIQLEALSRGTAPILGIADNPVTKELNESLDDAWRKVEPLIATENQQRIAESEARIKVETTRLVKAHRKAEIFSILAVPALLATFSGHTLKPEEIGSMATNVFQAGLMATSFNNSAVGQFLAPDKVNAGSIKVLAEVDRAMQYTRLREFVRFSQNPLTGVAQAAAFEASGRAASHAAALLIQRAAPRLAESSAGRGTTEVLGGLLGLAVSGVLTNRPITGLNEGMGSVVTYAAAALQNLQSSLQEAQNQYMSSYLDPEDSTEMSLSISGETDSGTYPSEIELQARAGWDPRVELYDLVAFEGTIDIEPQSLGPDSIESINLG